MGEARGTVLVVDDEEAVRSILCSRLRQEGYVCMEASDGKEALAKTTAHDFNAVLLDIRMPGMSGMETLPRIVAENPHACVVMLTAVVDMQTAVQALNLGACDYLPKPFELDDVVQRVGRALEGKRLVQQRQGD